MNDTSPDWPCGAATLLAQAKQQGDLVKLIMAGTVHIESWLIEHHIVPLLQGRQPGVLQFANGCGEERRTACLIPLPDGSAFARNSEGRWLALEREEACHEIEHIGTRFAPGDHWLNDFSAHIRWGLEAPAEIRPIEVAGVWEQITGFRPDGFAAGRRDEIEAFGFGVIDKVLHIQNRLGL